MYIDPFLAGCLATVGVELAGLVVLVIVGINKSRKG